MLEACDFCKIVPKTELHAHLSGSYSIDTLRKMARLTGKSELIQDWMAKDIWGFDDVFKYFKLAQAVSCSQEAVFVGTKDVIRDFYEDNCCYLELRTTPKNDGSMTPSDYFATLCKAVDEMSHEFAGNLVVKLIVSIDRRRSVEDASVAIRLAEEFKNFVVGIDLSGDPRVGDARAFIPILRKAKLGGWGLALHLGEIEGHQSETELILNEAKPDRIGHGTFIKGSQADFVRKERIPLEICQTSNLSGQTAVSYKDHHVQDWYKMDHPLSICTDDKGAFHTSLSKELHLAHHYLLGCEAPDRLVGRLCEQALSQALLSKNAATISEWNYMQDFAKKIKAMCEE